MNSMSSTDIDRISARESGAIQLAIAQLDLPEYVRWSYEHRDDLADTESWQSPLWNFARLLKAHPELQDGSPDRVLVLVDQVLGSWSDQSDTDQRWIESFDVNGAEDAHVELLSIWGRIRYVPGWEPLEQAVRRALKERLQVITRRTAGYELFVSVAGWLQVIMGDADILLPCEKLGTHLRCEAMTVSRYRRWAQDDRFLKLIKPHRFRGGRGEATTFRFDTAQFSVLAQSAKREE
jgi:hypothetical protein